MAAAASEKKLLETAVAAKEICRGAAAAPCHSRRAATFCCFLKILSGAADAYRPSLRWHPTAIEPLGGKVGVRCIKCAVQVHDVSLRSGFRACCFATLSAAVRFLSATASLAALPC